MHMNKIHVLSAKEFAFVQKISKTPHDPTIYPSNIEIVTLPKEIYENHKSTIVSIQRKSQLIINDLGHLYCDFWGICKGTEIYFCQIDESFK